MSLTPLNYLKCINTSARQNQYMLVAILSHHYFFLVAISHQWSGADLENSGGGVWPIPKRQNVDSLFNHKKSEVKISSF